MKIRKTKAGTYTTQIAIRDADGKRHSKRFTRSTKQELQAAVYEYQTIHNVYENSKTFADCLDKYIEAKKKVLSPSTILGYTMYQKVLTEQYKDFSLLNLDELNAKTIQDFIDDFSTDKEGNPRKQKTIKNYVSLISAVLKDSDYRMPPYTIRKDREKFSPNVPTQEIVMKISKVAKDTEWELPFALACMGLRRSEIAAVTSDDLSDDNLLHVRHALVRGSDYLYHEKATKTSESDRYILLPQSTADLLRQQKKAWKWQPAQLTGKFKKLLDTAGVDPFRLRDCRHFFASYCHCVLKLSDAEIQKLGGWKTDFVMKRVYISSITDNKKTVEQAFEKLLQ